MAKICPVEGCENEGVVKCYNAKYCYYTKTCPQELGWNKFCLEHVWAVRQKGSMSTFFCDPCIKHPGVKECYGHFVYAWKTSYKEFPQDFEEKWKNGEVFYASTFDVVPTDEPIRPKTMKITTMARPGSGPRPCSVEGCDNIGKKKCGMNEEDCPYGKKQRLCKNHHYYLFGFNEGGFHSESCEKCLKKHNKYARFFNLAIYYQGKGCVDDAIAENRACWILTGEKVTKESYKEYMNCGFIKNKHLYYDMSDNMLEQLIKIPQMFPSH